MLDLLDYRRRVFEIYRVVREKGDDPATWTWWRGQRDDLFRSHSQSALEADQKETFTGLRYYDYDPAFRVVATINTDIEPEVFMVELDEDGTFRYQRFARISFELPTGAGSLSLFWIMGYGGGLFLPFGDGTNRETTYGDGRYLYDTIKGADLGARGGEIVLDFNYAYNPSCVYNYRWVCPLAPPDNKLPFPITAGERLP
jgi:uncharacterized protein (DUF1684 family)